MKYRQIAIESMIHALWITAIALAFYLLLSHAISVSLDSKCDPPIVQSRLNPATQVRGVPRMLEEVFRPKRGVEYPRVLG